jgi:hypothetical protein
MHLLDEGLVLLISALVNELHQPALRCPLRLERESTINVTGRPRVRVAKQFLRLFKLWSLFALCREAMPEGMPPDLAESGSLGHRPDVLRKHRVWPEWPK